MNRNDELQKDVEALLELGKTGKLDFLTCTMKVARKVLEQAGCDEMLHAAIVGLMTGEKSLTLGVVCHLLTLRILRLEDDVRVLRSKVMKDRIVGIQENIENETYRGEGGKT